MGCASSVSEEIPVTNPPLPKQHGYTADRSRNMKPTTENKYNQNSAEVNDAIDTSENVRIDKTSSKTNADDIPQKNKDGDIKKTETDVEQTVPSAATGDAEEQVSLTRDSNSPERPSLNGEQHNKNKFNSSLPDYEECKEPKNATVGKESYSAEEISGSVTGIQTQADKEDIANDTHEKAESQFVSDFHHNDIDLPQDTNNGHNTPKTFVSNTTKDVVEEHDFKNADDTIDFSEDQRFHSLTQSSEQIIDCDTGQTESMEPFSHPSIQSSEGLVESLDASDHKTTSSFLDTSDTTHTTDHHLNVKDWENLKSNLLKGNVDIDCPKTAKIVRVFLSSTFTDTNNERNFLLGDTFTRMKEKCKAEGYEFQLVDMRWGVVQSIDNNHLTGEMCIKEIGLCQKLSTGPNFVTFLSHKYGYYTYPRTIESSEFEKLSEFISSESDLNLIKNWYHLDENSVPPTYVLQPISTCFPDFMSCDKDVYKKTKREWSKTCDRIINILFDANKKALPSSTGATNVIVGVTDSEIQQGILHNDHCEETCLWLKRDIKGLEDKVGQDQVNKYIDTIDESAWAARNKTLLTQLVNKLTDKLPKKNIISFRVQWEAKGINPDEYEEHKKYLKKFCDDFKKNILEMFKKALKHSRSEELNDKLLEEIAQHTRLCQEKCSDFCGRTKELMKLKMSVREENQTILVHGVSGSGKTSIMAALTEQCWSWYSEKAVIITRFIGATPESSRVGTLLASIIHQICRCYDQKLDLQPAEYSKLCKSFKESIKFATPEKKLFIFLDSFEQLDPEEEAMNIYWIPKLLPDNVKMVISTTSTDTIFTKLKTTLDKPPLIEIKQFTSEDAAKTLDKWFSQKKRKLTDPQMQIVNAAIEVCSLPLFLSLIFEEVSKWKSYMSVSETVLQQTTEKAIEHFFFQIEKMHGQKLVAHALGYLTLAKQGLSESELEDILSCDDEVLNELYVYWEPPVRRLPPLILVRLHSELNRYIAQREVEGTRVMFWNHSQFKEVFQKQYCSEENIQQYFYNGLAEFFSGTWAGDKKKPFKRKDKKDGSLEDAAKRKVAAQPLYFDKQCNLRKVNNLPWCLIATGNSRELATACLCNLEFLLAKLKHVGIRSLLDDFVDAVKKFKDEDFKLIKGALQLSQKALQRDVNQLPAQLITHLSYRNIEVSNELADLLEKCHEAPFPILVSIKTKLAVSEGSLSHSLPAHTSKVVGFDLSKSGDTAITFCIKGQLKVWDTKHGQLARSVDVPLDTIDNHISKPIKCLLAFNDQIIIVVTENTIFLYRADMGSQIAKLCFENKLNPPAVCVGGKKHKNDNAYIGLFYDSVWNLYHSKNLEPKIKNKDTGSLERGRLGLLSLCAGCSMYMAVTDEEHFYLRVFSLKDKMALQSRRVFPQFNVDNNIGELGHRIECMTFTRDEENIVVANMHENEILFLNSQSLNEMKRLKGFSDDSPLAYSLTADGERVLFPSHQNVVVRDLKDGNYRKSIAKHPCNVLFAATSQFDPLVSVGEDGDLRLWNNLNLRTDAWSKVDTTRDEDGQIRKIELFRTTSRYAVCVEVSQSSRHLSLHDLLSGQTVRRAVLSPVLNCDLKTVQRMNIEVAILNEDDQKITAVVKRSCGHLCEVDLNTMRVIKELDLQVVNEKKYHNGKGFTVLKIQQEMHVIALKHSAEQIDLLELSTEKKEKLFASECGEIDSFMVSERQLILVVKVNEIFTVVDIQQKRVVREIPPDCFEDEVELQGFSQDGNCLIFCGENDEWITCWNISKDEPLPVLDIYRGETDQMEFDDLAVDHVLILDNETLVCSFKTGTVRSCNLSTGKTQTLKADHVGEVTLSCSSKRTDLFVSYGCDPGDQTMVLWGKKGKTWEKVASYTSDNQLDHVQLSQNGTFVISCTQNPPSVVTWNLEGKHKYNEHPQPSQTNDILLQGENLNLTLDLTCQNWKQSPDSDDDDSDDEERVVKTPDFDQDDLCVHDGFE